ncbi:MAG: MMPL family transporter [Corynebacteriales bacterium]|nr:MMPL family transporter [Mycobacteriales bacterium]
MANPTEPNKPAPAPTNDPEPPLTRRWRWFLSPALILLWLIIALPLGGFQSKLADVQENDAAAWLPESAESTRVVELQKKFQDDELMPAVIVYEHPSGITEADRAIIAQQQREIEAADLKREAIPAPRDGKTVNGSVQAVALSVPLAPGDDGWERAAEDVTELRDITADSGDMTTYVTGPGGLAADSSEAFGDIDTTLLLTTGIVVAVILVIIYRSPILPFVVLLSVAMALGLASAVIYFLSDASIIDLNAQSQGILSVLVFGATTDYALLLISRYREELRRHPHAKDAMRTAYKAAWAPILASGATVMVGLMCLLFSDLSSNKGLGPVGALGIAASLAVALTFMPAVLAVLRRGAFWPFRPAYTSAHEPEHHGLWGRISRFVGKHARATWITTTAVLLVVATFASGLDTSGLTQEESFTNKPESVRGQESLSMYFPGGETDPAIVIGNADKLPELTAAIKETEGVAQGEATVWPTVDGPPGTRIGEPEVVDGLVEINAILEDPIDSQGAKDTVDRLRENVHKVPGADGQVGGFAAVSSDILETSARDLRVIVPIVLLVIFVILAFLLRALVAPVLLIATVVLSFAATLGVSALVFDHVFGHPTSDPSIPLFGFIFLVALGIDYNIFLMTRVREESIKSGTRAGTLTGLRVTGGVITSAGVVLAATFSVLAILPLVFLLQMGFIVAFGVLLDTLVVRSFLVPSATLEIGEKIWWPGKLRSRKL